MGCVSPQNPARFLRISIPIGSLLAALLLASLGPGCSGSPAARDRTLANSGPDPVVQSKTAPEISLYAGMISMKSPSGVLISKPLQLRLESWPGEGRIDLTASSRDVKGKLETITFYLERIGTTNTFLASDLNQTLKGQMRFQSGAAWNWSEWVLGLQKPDGTAIAGAAVLSDDRQSLTVKLENLDGQGRAISTATGSLFPVTELSQVPSTEPKEGGP